MAAVDGDWDVTIKSPMGDQKAVLTVNSDGSSFSGQMSGGLGAMDIASGTVDGDTGSATGFTLTPSATLGAVFLDRITIESSTTP